MSTGWIHCKKTLAYLKSLEVVLERWTSSRELKVRDIVMQNIKMGGKRLRPSLLLLAGSFGKDFDKQLVYPAAGLELLHVASLYHDDVMDRAATRRNAASVNSVWGNATATYAGNYLFARSINLLAHVDPLVNQIVCTYVSDLCLGQLKEAENAYNTNIELDTHQEIIRMKTASLFELPCYLGSTLSNADLNVTAALKEYGRSIGLAFQIIDDLLDLTGDEKKMGKSTGTDIKEGIYSYALIAALRAAGNNNHLSNLLLNEHITAEEIREVQKIARDSGGVTTALTAALTLIGQAREAISILPETDAKKSLINLTELIVSRQN